MSIKVQKGNNSKPNNKKTIYCHKGSSAFKYFLQVKSGGKVHRSTTIRTLHNIKPVLICVIAFLRATYILISSWLMLCSHLLSSSQLRKMHCDKFADVKPRSSNCSVDIRKFQVSSSTFQQVTKRSEWDLKHCWGREIFFYMTGIFLITGLQKVLPFTCV